MTDEMREHLRDMGILEVKPQMVTYVLPKREVKYIYNDPRDPITGEVPF
tara:strand:- start:796 stop:942 length:147 start_codon:yes stop_codon:yes gene_type:complete